MKWIQLIFLFLLIIQFGIIWYWTSERIAVIPASIDMSINLSEGKSFAFYVDNLGMDKLDISYSVIGIPKNWITLPNTTAPLNSGDKNYIIANVLVNGANSGQYRGEILVKKKIDEKILARQPLMLTVNRANSIEPIFARGLPANRIWIAYANY